MEKRRQIMELQTEVSIRAQEKLQAESQAERLSLELRCIKEQLHAASEEKPSDPNPKPSVGEDKGLSQVRLTYCLS